MKTQQQKSTKSAFYKWHRVLGLISLVPVIFWTISGLSHPFMANWFRPSIPEEIFKPLRQQQMAPKLSISQIMDQHHLKQLRNFNLINFDKGSFYQVLNPDSTYTYYSASNGGVLNNGDQLYATYLARYFTQDTVSSVSNIKLQTRFDVYYPPINRLLPVWKVTFNRPDGMDVYIETSQSRMGTFNNKIRKAFLWIFSNFHNWQFLADAAGETFRICVLLVVIMAMLFSLISGIVVYGLFWNRFKQIRQKQELNGRSDKRFVHRYHRQLGLIVSLVMFTFTISGAFHLWVKLKNRHAVHQPFQQLIERVELRTNNLHLAIADSLIQRTNLVKFNNHLYYQVLDAQKEQLYFDAGSGKPLVNGNQKFALFLSDYYRINRNNQQEQQPLKLEVIKQFTAEYGFINKRLPVVKISYPGQEDFYIETSSAKLAAQVAGLDRAEGLSFIFLHKYFGMTWAGKDLRDIVSMLAAAGVLVVSLFGFAAFLKNK